MSALVREKSFPRIQKKNHKKTKTETKKKTGKVQG